MSITQTISAITGPSPDSPDTWEDDADSFVQAMEGVPGELNTWAGQANAMATATQDAESNAADSETAAAASAVLAAQWAATLDALVAGTDYSAAEWAVGTTVPAGSAKAWAVAAEDDEVTTGQYSALHWAAKAESHKDTAEAAAAAAQSAAGLPSLAGNAGAALLVNQAEDGVAWGEISTVILAAQVIGSTADDQDLDLSAYRVFELEPTADISINVTTLPSGDDKAIAYLQLKNGGNHTLTFQAGGSENNAVLPDGLTLTPQLIESADLSSVAHLHNQFHVADLNDSVRFSSDGLRGYVLYRGFTVQQKDYVTPYAESGSYTGFKQFNTQTTNAVSMFFSPDGEKFFLLSGDGVIYSYTLSTPWDITSATYDSVSYSTDKESAVSLYFKPDGRRMFISVSNRLHAYEVASAWNLAGSVTYTGGSGYISSLKAAWISDDGYTLFTADGDSVSARPITTAWAPEDGLGSVIATASVAAQETNITDIAFDFGRARMLVVGSSSNYCKVYEVGADSVTNFLDVLHLLQVSDTKVAVNLMHSGVVV